MNCLKQQGMVLLTVLMALGLMAMLLMANMQSLFLYDKLLQAFELKDQVIEQLEKTARDKLILWGKFPGHDCLVRDLGPNLVINYMFTHGCMIESSSIKLRYLIDDLGLIPGVHVTQDKKIFPVKQGLITVVTADNHRLGVQIRMAFIAPLLEMSQQTPTHPMALGVMSWRLIEDYDEH